jgi:hypothetical protein
MVCFVNIREGESKREKESVCVPVKWQRERERERRIRMTRHNQNVSTPALNSLHKLQEVNYFSEKVKKKRLTSDVQYQHSSTFLSSVKKCDNVV